MDESVIWIIFAFWVLFALFFAWLIGFTELSYFGNKGLKFLYDFCAPAYNLKWINPQYRSKELTEKLFVDPLKSSLAGDPNAKFLDLACGTGRMSLMVLSQEWFKGKVTSIDFSDGMLDKFRQELKLLGEEQKSRCKIQQLNLLEWKANSSEKHNSERYNVVALMEVGEFLPNFVELIPKIAKSIEDQGLFLLTKPPDWMAHLYPGRQQTKKELMKLLEESGFNNISILPWTNRYEVVWAFRECSNL